MSLAWGRDTDHLGDHPDRDALDALARIHQQGDDMRQPPRPTGIRQRGARKPGEPPPTCPSRVCSRRDDGPPPMDPQGYAQVPGEGHVTFWRCPACSEWLRLVTVATEQPTLDLEGDTR